MSSRGEVLYDLLRLVRPIVLGSARVVDEGLRGTGWTVGSRAVMEVLVVDGAATVPRVATRLSLARQNVQRQVDELVRLGHVATAPNPDHRRSVLVAPTAEGRRLFGRVHDRELADLARLAPECSVQEIAAATEVLRSVEAAVRARWAQ
ncbi:winged helix-turn-helix transcriptional regulator [Nocardioides sp. zg-1308]|uniref:MarR family winged helix-turn-helix transcriptional regulator n=1 Tax=Nocardioides renjunii TaxID=3095075 RepID=A0ABU5KEJ8_9ACTN|nr:MULTISPECIES: MarR family winged helix-turn-helix transcriptional regulator [unclassified Nocardioides]MDZ5662874.1 MarR family winged helix-turn-helix transcriptional regulator [Nocardioides sp. S-58]NPD05458.1 winged helix-turn-helix transcriptional regulator [Nocardioides sp. zg-1308]WQQ23345.1 MarR family winged helix-turn-helix transcriptional regulator [Nocardioides sp. S-34]